MLKMIITATLHNSAEKDIIGIKEALTDFTAEWIDVWNIDVKEVSEDCPPEQIDFESLSPNHKPITVDDAVNEILSRNLTVEDMQNFITALIKASNMI